MPGSPTQEDITPPLPEPEPLSDAESPAGAADGAPDGEPAPEGPRADQDTRDTAAGAPAGETLTGDTSQTDFHNWNDGGRPREATRGTRSRRHRLDLAQDERLPSGPHSRPGPDSDGDASSARPGTSSHSSDDDGSDREEIVDVTVRDNRKVRKAKRAASHSTPGSKRRRKGKSPAVATTDLLSLAPHLVVATTVCTVW